nr:hypothetical protein [Tanacetum cinerariifolium]
MVDERVNEIAKKTVPLLTMLSLTLSLNIKFEKPATPIAPCQIAAVRTKDHEDHLDDDARPEGKSSAKRQNTFEHGTYTVGESSSEQVMNDEPNPSGSGEEHRYHVDQMHNYLKSDMVWESIKEDLSLQLPKKPTLVYHSCQRDPKAPPMTLLNQDLFYLKYGNSGLKKYIISLHKQEKQRGKPKEVYSDSKIVEVIKTLYELGHEHKYITVIVVRRADGKFGAFSESNYKHLNKNDIEDLYLMKKLLSITSKPVVGMIYENRKKEKSVMKLKGIPKFFDATVKRVLEMVKKFKKDLKYGYADPSPSVADAEYLEFYKEYIEDRLKHNETLGIIHEWKTTWFNNRTSKTLSAHGNEEIPLGHSIRKKGEWETQDEGTLLGFLVLGLC